jgi:hypothetical protein
MSLQQFQSGSGFLGLSKPVPVLLSHQSQQERSGINNDSFPFLQSPPCLAQKLPDTILASPKEQSLPLPSRPLAPAKQSGRQNTRIVEHQQITRSEQLGKISKGVMCE